MKGHYLPADILHRLIGLCTLYPIGSLGTALLVIGMVYGLLAWRVGRGGSGVMLFSVILSAVLFFVGTGVWIVLHSPGYRVF